MRRQLLRCARLLQAGLPHGARPAVNTVSGSSCDVREAVVCLVALSDRLRVSRSVAQSWRPAGVAAYASAAAPQPTDAVQQFRLAQTGEGIKECELVRWFVAEGDEVEEFGRMCEVQSDKATIEITSPFSGVVRRLHHSPGDVVQVGEVLADIHTQYPGHAAAGQHLAAAAEAEEGVALATPPCGTTARGLHGVNGAAVAAVDTQAAAAAAAAAGFHGSEAECAQRVLTSPAVRRLAKEHGLDLRMVAASGPDGRVTKGDVLAYLDSLSAAPTSTVGEEAMEAVTTTEAAGVAAAAAAAPLPHVARPEHIAAAPAVPGTPTVQQPLPALAAAGEEGEAAQPIQIPLRGYRKAMLRSMTLAGQIPHFHYCDEIQVDALVQLRQALAGDPALAGAKLTFLPFLIKAAALAIRQFPLVNASLSEDQASILQHAHVNLGVAMATPHGLVVPNIKNVQNKSIAGIAQELARLQAAAAANQLRPADVSGGTFTLSNIGTIGGTYATPLVNPPEVAIMAVGRVSRVPRLNSDESGIVPASVLNISLGADHRVVDGATLAGFARAWRQFVENPGTLLLHLQ